MNTVYIIGGDHHNGLGLARILGINGVEVRALIICNNKKSFLSKSKYVSKCFVFPSEKKAFDYLLSVKTNESKPILIPYSDAAALELDSRLDEFKDCFYVPSINNIQGEIVDLMDKQKQYEFAVSHGIRMAFTVTVNLESEKHQELINVPYPCIIKPVISAEGDKRDIAIANNYGELLSVIKGYKKIGYHRALVQEYLTIDYEIDVFGCILRQKPYVCQVPTRTIRSWLPKCGTNSFSQIITDPDILEGCREIINEIKDYGFYGLYDIELFVVNGQIVLNEINLRNSGDVYMGINQGYYYPYAWYCDVLGKPADILANPQYDAYTMTECADIRNVLIRNLSFGDWYKDYKKCKDYALRFAGDMRPARSRYMYYVIQYAKGKKL